MNITLKYCELSKLIAYQFHTGRQDNS